MWAHERLELAVERGGLGCGQTGVDRARELGFVLRIKQPGHRRLADFLRWRNWIGE